MILSSSRDHPIFVEVYEVDAATLSKLDQLEAPYDCRRQTVFLSELIGRLKSMCTAIPIHRLSSAQLNQESGTFKRCLSSSEGIIKE